MRHSHSNTEFPPVRAWCDSDLHPAAQRKIAVLPFNRQRLFEKAVPQIAPKRRSFCPPSGTAGTDAQFYRYATG